MDMMKRIAIILAALAAGGAAYAQNVQTAKTFYEKDGKYYVVEGGFRHGIKKSDNAQGKTTDWTDYWPGLKTPVEIPADKIQGVKF